MKWIIAILIALLCMGCTGNGLGETPIHFMGKLYEGTLYAKRETIHPVDDASWGGGVAVRASTLVRKYANTGRGDSH